MTSRFWARAIVAGHANAHGNLHPLRWQGWEICTVQTVPTLAINPLLVEARTLGLALLRSVLPGRTTPLPDQNGCVPALDLCLPTMLDEASTAAGLPVRRDAEGEQEAPKVSGFTQNAMDVRTATTFPP